MPTSAWFSIVHPASSTGRLCGVSVLGGTSVSYSYDVMGRVTASSQTTDGVTYPFTYAYNQAGGVESTTLPSGRSLKQCYDVAGRAKSVTGTKSGEAAHDCISQITYDAGGGMNQAQLGNGKWEDWDYNYRKQVIGIKLGATAGASDLLSLTYGYGTAANNGNVLSQAITRPSFSVTQTYGYTDPLNRLSSVTEGTDSRTFDYSATGNMWVATASTNFAAGSFTPRTSTWYNANNRLVNTGLGIAYDLAGNQTAIGGYTNTFDAENRLTSSTINSVTTSYAYDGDGRRVKKGSMVMVYDAFGKLAAEYGGAVTSAGPEYLTGDHLGSTRLVTNAAGTATKCADYLPFGEEIGQGVNGRGTCYGFTDPRQKFTGKERDAETGLDFFLARYYSGAQGRFTSPDWSETPQPVPYADFADPQTLNLYSYARNNPLALTDPDGHCPWCIGAAVGGFGGLAASYFGQKWSHPDKPINWKSVFASGIGGAVAGGSLGLATAPGAVTTLMGETLIETGLAVKLTTAGITGMAGGMVTRGIESNADPNKTIGTPSEILTDAAMGAAGEGLGKVAGPGVKATTTAGRVVTLNEARVAAGTRTPASYGVRQGQLKTQQQVVGGVLGASADAAVRSRQEAAKRRAEEERNRQPGQQ